MSRGTTLFSRGTVEADRWIDMGRDCTIQHGPPACQSAATLESLWAVLPDQCKQNTGDRFGEVGNAPAITSLIRDLSLGDARLCRSLSFSDEFGSCRSSWRPQGSRVWTAVEKRRCHSGGSVRPGVGAAAAAAPSSSSWPSGGHFPAIQRSFSFSLPSRSCILVDGAALELPCFTQGLAFQPLFTASPLSPKPHLPQSHRDPDHSPGQPSLSRERISLSEARTEEEEEEDDVSDASSPDSTPELGRRIGGLSRSRSQPCELNDKKISMKRRRPEDAQEQRPSLDLAKMTQCYQWSEPPYRSAVGQVHPSYVPASHPGPKVQYSSYEADPDSGDSACSVGSPSGSPVDMEEEEEEDDEEEERTEHTLRKGVFQGTRGSLVHLGEELDLDQIERN
ncbi:hypothetical protein NHX12_022544 [Muraenolepis orangiensis]|uniref:Protein FAM53B n=1 Tax=Muraenolepis orangiensis TaxID=630683 RepID=A0A9Q0IRD2_9TELE|nr:hypothetical protein NHX12_022544 [Muraenolepis orangiensis]